MNDSTEMFVNLRSHWPSCSCSLIQGVTRSFNRPQNQRYQPNYRPGGGRVGYDASADIVKKRKREEDEDVKTKKMKIKEEC